MSSAVKPTSMVIRLGLRTIRNRSIQQTNSAGQDLAWPIGSQASRLS
jgi:hypothetical protein